MQTLTQSTANRWLWLTLLAALVALTGCLTGDGTAPTATQTVFRRWGYDILLPTGQSDPPPLFIPLPAGYRIETVLTGLDRPTALAATPDGRLLVAEQPGTVRVVQDGRLLDDPFISVDLFLTVDDHFHSTVCGTTRVSIVAVKGLLIPKSEDSDSVNRCFPGHDVILDRLGSG